MPPNAELTDTLNQIINSLRFISLQIVFLTVIVGVGLYRQERDRAHHNTTDPTADDEWSDW